MYAGRLTVPKPKQSQDGVADTTKIGYRNPNDQVCLGQRDIHDYDTFYVYEVYCLRCGELYCAYGQEMYQRRCPNCDGGSPSIYPPEYRIRLLAGIREAVNEAIPPSLPPVD